MSETVLETHNLIKRYKGRNVLDGANMTVRRGDIYGFVGKNGAGKTTLIRTVSGLANPDGGSFCLFGQSYECSPLSDLKCSAINAARRRTCAMVESPSVYPELTAEQNMRAQCLILKRPFKESGELLEYVGLGGTGKKKVRDFSLGMRQRLYIAMSLLGSPEFMLLDEPINGLDPEGIHDVRRLLARLNSERGLTILISSHILAELSLLATTYGFIDGGRIIKEISADELEKATARRTRLVADKPEEAGLCLRKLGYSPERQGDALITDGEADVMKVCLAFKDAGIYLLHYSCEGVDLEDYFMNLIGGSL